MDTLVLFSGCLGRGKSCIELQNNCPSVCYIFKLLPLFYRVIFKKRPVGWMFVQLTNIFWSIAYTESKFCNCKVHNESIITIKIILRGPLARHCMETSFIQDTKYILFILFKYIIMSLWKTITVGESHWGPGG